MADASTTTYSFTKPEVGASEDSWGGKLNANWDSVDDLLDGTTAITPNLGSGWEVGGVAVTATAAELNALDGLTATTAELNILDGVTATAAEINLLDGVTATTAEINYVDGVTSAIQTQLDAKAPLASPTFTGTPAVPTASEGTNTTQAASTEFVTTAVAAVPNPIKAWVNFTVSGGTATVADGLNVSSVTRNGTGDFTVNFTSNLANATYALSGSADRPGFSRPLILGPSGNVATPFTVSSARFVTTNDGGTNTDPGLCTVIIVGSDS